MSYKVCVYAISKNEVKHIDRWVRSMSEADEIYVLDTGSEDATVEKLTALGVHVISDEIKPWRFDVARNKSLSLVPKDTDICVCTDIDEVFDQGWRNRLELFWAPDTTLAHYRYVWSSLQDNSDGIVFMRSNIHSRNDFVWKYPVHEYLEYIGNVPHEITLHGVQLRHYSDTSKPRNQYLPLLELSVKEDQYNDRNVYYLGREYMFYGQWDKCIETLQNHIAMPTAVWRDERSASMRHIAHSYAEKKDFANAEIWAMKSVCEAPYLREPYIETANILYKEKKWEGIIYFISNALMINYHSDSYLNEPNSWGSLPYDLISIAYYYTGQYKAALDASIKAISLCPEDERLINNNSIIRICN